MFRPQNISLAALFAFSMALPCHTFGDSPDARTLQRIAAAHEGFESDVVSGIFDIRIFRASDSFHERNQLYWDPQEFESLVRESDLATGGETGFRGLLESYLGHTLSDAPWAQTRGRFVFEGNRVREQIENSLTISYDGADMVRSSQISNQVEIGTPSTLRLKVLELSDFRPTFDGEFLRSAEVVESSDREIEVADSEGLLELTLDRETGLVRRLAKYKRTGLGRILKLLAFYPGTLPDVQLPTAAAEIKYRDDGRILHIDLMSISNAKVNVDIDDSEFRQRAAEGIVVVDHRRQSTTGRSFSAYLSEPTHDVAASYSVGDSLVTAGKVERSSRTSMLFWIFNLVILVVVGSLVIRKRYYKPLTNELA